MLGCKGLMNGTQFVQSYQSHIYLLKKIWNKALLLELGPAAGSYNLCQVLLTQGEGERYYQLWWGGCTVQCFFVTSYKCYKG